MTHVFLSYSRRDSAFMRRLRSDLQAVGLEVWTDETGLEPGTPSWERVIVNELNRAGCMVVVLSPDAAESEWVGRELAAADELGLRIFPIMARGQAKDSVPLRLKTHQRIDARRDYMVALQRLQKALIDHLGLEALSGPSEQQLPEELRVALESPLVGVRAGAVEELARLLDATLPETAEAARMTLERMRNDDSRQVSAAAQAALAVSMPMEEADMVESSTTTIRPAVKKQMLTSISAATGPNGPISKGLISSLKEDIERVLRFRWWRPAMVSLALGAIYVSWGNSGEASVVPIVLAIVLLGSVGVERLANRLWLRGGLLLALAAGFTVRLLFPEACVRHVLNAAQEYVCTLSVGRLGFSLAFNLMPLAILWLIADFIDEEIAPARTESFLRRWWPAAAVLLSLEIVLYSRGVIWDGANTIYSVPCMEHKPCMRAAILLQAAAVLPVAVVTIREAAKKRWLCVILLTTVAFSWAVVVFAVQQEASLSVSREVSWLQNSLGLLAEGRLKLLWEIGGDPGYGYLALRTSIVAFIPSFLCVAVGAARNRR